MTWFDTGARGVTPLYGIVEAVGPKRVTVRWESGARQRLRRGDQTGELVLKARHDVDPWALKRLETP
jgi:hypothetical protein